MSGVSFAVTDTAGFNNYSSGETDPTHNLFGSFIVDLYPASIGDKLTFTFSGLTPGIAVNLAMYAGDLGHRSGDIPVTFVVNGVTETSVGPANGGGAFILNTAASAGNYEVVPTTADSSGNITIVALDEGGNYAEISGFGIQVVPEPSTWVSSLLLGGLGALAGFERMRRRA